MANPLLQDSLVMQSLFDKAMSPLENYSQGLMALAIQKRARDQQLADAERVRQQHLDDLATARQEKLGDANVARAEALADYEKLKADNAAIAALKRQQEVGDKALADYQAQQNKKSEDQRRHNNAIAEIKATYDAMSDKDREKQKTKDIATARKYGAVLDDNATDSEVASALVKYGGEAYIAASKAVGNVVKSLYEAGEIDPIKLRNATALNLAADDAVAEVTTPAQRQEIIQNPDKIIDILAKYQKNKKIFNPLSEAYARVSSQTKAQMQSELDSKEHLAIIREQARKTFTLQDEIARDLGGIASPTILKANQDYLDEARRQQASPTVAPIKRPPPRQVIGGFSNQVNQSPGITGPLVRRSSQEDIRPFTNIVRSKEVQPIFNPSTGSPFSVEDPLGIGVVNPDVWMKTPFQNASNSALGRTLSSQAAAKDLFTPLSSPAARGSFFPGSIDPVTGEPIY